MISAKSVSAADRIRGRSFGIMLRREIKCGPLNTAFMASVAAAAAREWS
jgi:hypothetical protein